MSGRVCGTGKAKKKNLQTQRTNKRQIKERTSPQHRVHITERDTRVGGINIWHR